MRIESHGKSDIGNEITSYLSDADLSGVPGALIDLANERGGHDNATAVVVRADATATDTARIGSDETGVRTVVRALRAARSPFLKAGRSPVDSLGSRCHSLGRLLGGLSREPSSSAFTYIILASP